jgi:hypothetical protein
MDGLRMSQRTTQSIAASMSAGLARFELLSICVIAFGLPAFNGRPLRFSSGFVCLPVALCLLIYSSKKRRTESTIPKRSRSITFVLAAWSLIATVSAVANLGLGMEPVINLLWGYWVPFLLFLSIVGLNPAPKDFQWIIGSLALGLALRFGYGILVFYYEWGLPEPGQLLSVRFDVRRMTTYMDATFGNTGNSAAIIVATLPMLLLSLNHISIRRSVRVLIIISVVVLIANLFITGSRAAIITMAVMIAIAAFKMKGRWRYLVTLFLGFFVYVFIEFASSADLARFTAAATVDARVDYSIASRIESNIFGLDLMLKNPLGIGPGMSYIYSRHSVAHQLAIAQGSELGVLGMMCVFILFGFVIRRTVSTSLISTTGAGNASAIFHYGALSWFMYAMIASNPLNSGVTIPWVGLLLLFLSLGEAFTAPSVGIARQTQQACQG